MSHHPKKYGIVSDGRPVNITRVGLLVGAVGVYGFLVLILASVLALVTLIANGVCAVWPWMFRAHWLGFGEDGFMTNWLVAISASDRLPSADRTHDEVFPPVARRG